MKPVPHVAIPKYPTYTNSISLERLEIRLIGQHMLGKSEHVLDEATQCPLIDHTHITVSISYAPCYQIQEIYELLWGKARRQ
jgi:hypothetical protein